MIALETTYWGLFSGALLAATVLPGGSEPMLYAALRVYPTAWLSLWVVASLGNTFGGMSSYALGRWIPHRQTIRYEPWLRRYGAVSVVLSWVPLVGDALCVGAGWLRLPWPQVLGWMMLGKAARYLAIVALTL